MRFSSLLAAAAAAATCVSGSPVGPSHAVHEKRDIIPHGWQKHDEALRKDFVMPMKIGLSQSNLDKAYDYLMDVSHPEAPNFGKHWTAKQVKETFAPRFVSISRTMIAADSPLAKSLSTLSRHGSRSLVSPRSASPTLSAADGSSLTPLWRKPSLC